MDGPLNCVCDYDCALQLLAHLFVDSGQNGSIVQVGSSDKVTLLASMGGRILR